MFKMKTTNDYEPSSLATNLNEFLNDINLVNGKKKKISIYGHKIWSNNLFFDANQSKTASHTSTAGSISSQINHINNNNPTSSVKLPAPAHPSSTSPPLNFSFLNDKTDEFIESLFKHAEKEEEKRRTDHRFNVEISPNRRVLSTLPPDPAGRLASYFNPGSSHGGGVSGINTISENDADGESDPNVVPTVIDLNSSLNNTLTYLSETSNPNQNNSLSSSLPVKVSKLSQLAEPLNRSEAALLKSVNKPRLNDISNRLRNMSSSEKQTNILFQLARVHSNNSQLSHSSTGHHFDPLLSSRKYDKSGNLLVNIVSSGDIINEKVPKKKNIQVLKKINLSSLRRATLGLQETSGSEHGVNSTNNDETKKKKYIQLTATASANHTASNNNDVNQQQLN